MREFTPPMQDHSLFLLSRGHRRGRWRLAEGPQLASHYRPGGGFRGDVAHPRLARRESWATGCGPARCL